MTEDLFSATADSPMAPAEQCFPVIPSDTSAFAVATKALYVGTGGDVVVRALRASADVTFRNVPDGGVLDVRAVAVRATGTTAGDIVGLA